MASIINATTASGGGIVQTADASGNLALQGNGTTVATATPTGFQVNTYSPVASLITSGTAVASTSGTSIDFTGIPSWAKRITVMFNGVSLSGTANPLIQIGSGSVTTTGYLSYATVTDSASAATSSTSGYLIYSNTAAALIYGTMQISLVSGNTYIGSGCMAMGTSARSTTFGGNVSLSGALDRVRITTSNGTDTFDAGSINIMYE